MVIIEGLAPEHKLGDQKKITQDNADYNKPLEKSLDDQKQELKDSIFGSFKNPDELIDPSLSIKEEDVQKKHHLGVDDFSDTPTEEEYLALNNINDYGIEVEGGNDFGAKGIPENNEPVVESLYSQPLKENKYFPMIKRLHESNQLSTEAFENIQNEIYTNNGEFDIKKLKIEGDSKELLKGLMIHLDGENREQNILDFGKDIKNIDEFSDLNLDLSIDGKFESNVLNDIGKNYIKIPDEGNNINIKEDISTAIEATSANILKNIKNIPKDSQTFKTSIINIESGNLKQQLEGITTLNTLAYSGEGKLVKKEVNKYTEKRKDQLKNKALLITIDIKNAKKENNQSKLDKLNLEKENLIKEANEIDSGDVFEAGENDKVGEDDPLGNLEQA